MSTPVWHRSWLRLFLDTHGLSPGQLGEILLAEFGLLSRSGGGADFLHLPQLHPPYLAGDGLRQLVELQPAHALERGEALAQVLEDRQRRLAVAGGAADK